VGIGLAAASLVLDLGWVAWIAALVLVGAAVVFTLGRTRASAIVGLVVAAAIVAGGILVVNVAPPLPAKWIVLPDFTAPGANESILLVGLNTDVVVVLDDDKPALVGYDFEGHQLWSNSAANSGGYRYGVLAGASVVTYPAGGSAGGASVVSIATGETEWSVELGEAEPFSANDEVIVFADTDRTFALDRQTGDPVWSLGFEPTATSEGQSSYSHRRWTSHADWVVVRDVEASQLLVVNSRTGDIATAFPEDVFITDWAIAGDTLLTFGFEDLGERFVKGTPLTGGAEWKSPIHDFHTGAFYEAIGSDLRIVGDARVEWVDGETGDTRTVEIPAGWSFARVYSGIDGAMSLVAKRRDSEGSVTAVGVFDSVTGAFTQLEATLAGDAQVQEATPAGTLLSLPYVDAVGGEHQRLVLVPNTAD
jgi:outer membrane protein assembly factor BamB